MNNISVHLQKLSADETEVQFEPFEEEAIVSIGLDNPEYFISIHHLLDANMFTLPHIKFIINELIACVDKHQTVPTRPAFLSIIKKQLTTDSIWWEEAVDAIRRPANYRDIPMVKEKLDGWIKRKQIEKLYAPEGLEAFESGDFERLIDIVEGITKFNQTSYQCFSLVEDIEQLFVPSEGDHITTGYNSLDKHLNDGGPSAGEVIIYMGPTNVGKTIFLCNTAVAHFKAGFNTLVVTFELSTKKTARRILAPFTGIPVDNLNDHQVKLADSVRKMNATYGNDIRILEWPPDEVSVNGIYTALQNLKRSFGFIPQSIVIDYMDLMVSSRDTDNDKDYTRQKYVAYQIRALAKKSGCLVTTATQTNRSGNDISSGLIDLTKSAESYGKTMPTDYVVTLNQNVELHSKGQIMMYVAKNRNGPKNVSVLIDVNYNLLSTKEHI